VTGRDTLHLLSAGAARGLAQALIPAFEAAYVTLGTRIRATATKTMMRALLNIVFSSC